MSVTEIADLLHESVRAARKRLNRWSKDWGRFAGRKSASEFIIFPPIDPSAADWIAGYARVDQHQRRLDRWDAEAQENRERAGAPRKHRSLLDSPHYEAGRASLAEFLVQGPEPRG